MAIKDSYNRLNRRFQGLKMQRISRALQAYIIHAGTCHCIRAYICEVRVKVT